MVKIVVVAASADGLNPLRQIITELPDACASAIFVVWHIGAHASRLPELLSHWGPLPAVFAQHGAAIDAGRIYVAPPDHHLLLKPGQMVLDHGPKVRNTRPAADPLFISAAHVYRDRVMGIVLSGGDSDGAEGLRAVVSQGGIGLVQDPEEAASPSMPLSAIATDHPDDCLSAHEIAQRVATFCYATG